MQNPVRAYFLALLRQALRDPKVRPPVPLTTDEEWKTLFIYICRNKLEGLCLRVLQSEPAAPSWLIKYLHQQVFKDLNLDNRQQYTIAEIRDVFTQRNIPFAFVKGVYLKHDYPETHQRFMSDIDIIVEPDFKAQAEQALVQMGGTLKGYDGNDGIFKLHGNVTVETHRYLFFRRQQNGVMCYSDWRYFDRENNALTEEGFALQMICHMVSNLCKGGLGIRYVMDLWVYRHCHKTQPDWNAVMEQLQVWGLAKVTQNLIALSEHWFGDDDTPFPLPELIDDIMNCSLYGKPGKSAVNNASLAGGRVKAALSQIFLPRSELEKRFPWCKKSPLLLPAAFFARCYQTAAHHSKAVNSWLKTVSQTDEAEIQKQREYLKKVGFFD